jgi:hypothetical protein
LQNHSAGGGGEEGENGEMPSKKMRTSDKFDEVKSLKLLNDAEIDTIKQRMDSFDKMREDVIKQSRDVQKQAKAAIFSVHRGNYIDARAKLDSALLISKKIMLKMLRPLLLTMVTRRVIK